MKNDLSFDRSFRKIFIVERYQQFKLINDIILTHNLTYVNTLFEKNIVFLNKCCFVQIKQQKMSNDEVYSKFNVLFEFSMYLFYNINSIWILPDCMAGKRRI